MKQTILNRFFNTIKLLRIALRTRKIDKKVAINDTIVNRNHQLIIDNMNDTVVGLDILADKFTFVSGAYNKVYGYTAEEYLSKRVKDIMTPESYQLVQETIKREFGRYFAGETDQPYATLEILKYHKDGHKIWTEISARAIVKPETREIIEIISISRDIDDKKRAELKVIEQKEELERANNSKNIFFSIISHDLRNQVTALVNVSAILSEHFSKMSYNDAIKHIETLSKSVSHFMVLFENLLLWSRSVMGGIEININENNIDEITKSALSEVELQGKQKQIEFLYRNNSQTNIVRCDFFMINTILRNLVSNAIKFSNNCSKISVLISKHSDDEHIVVSIKDEGVGINAEKISQLFKLNTKVTTLGTANEKGTGMGLILCKEFIDRHKCDIWVESEIGKGTAFSFTLPKVS